MKQYKATFFNALVGGIGLVTLVTVGVSSSALAQGKHPKMKITVAQANAIALKKYPGKVVGKTPLEDEEGKWQYGVMVRSGKTLREVMVNGMTGHIDSVEVTTAKKETLEKKHDADKASKTHAKSSHTSSGSH